MAQKSNIQCRWMIRKDSPKIIEIENMSQPDPWSSQELVHNLNKINTIGMVAVYSDKNSNEEVVGYIIYELNKGFFQISRFAVHTNYRRKGIGKKLLERISAKFARDKRSFVDIIVRETNLNAQLFFRSQKFKALRVLRQQFEDTDEDGYLMRLRLEDRVPQLV